MKKLGVIISCLLIVITACKKDSGNGGNNNNNDILGCMDKTSLNYNMFATKDDGSCISTSQKRYGFVLEYTSTWCHYCGMWGHDTLNGLIQKYGDDLVAIAVHCNLGSSADPMLVDTLFKSFNTYTGYNPDVDGPPSFFIGNVKGANNYSSLINTQMKQTPWAGVVLKSDIYDGNMMEIKTLTKFFDNPPNNKWFGDWYINVYILENNINGDETAPGAYKQILDAGVTKPGYKHNHVLRMAVNSKSAFGDLLISGSVSSPILSGSVVKKNYYITLDPSWNFSNLKVVAVVWVKNPGYTYVNGYVE